MNPPVITRIVLPLPVLRPHLRCFGIRQFDTGGLVFPKAVITEHEILMNFFIHSKVNGFETIDPAVENSFNYSNTIEAYFTGIQTSTKGFVQMKGPTSIITLHFRPTGFYHIFKMSPKEVTNQFGQTNDLLGLQINLLYEQLQECSGIQEAVHVLESYLLKKLFTAKRQYDNPAITYAANCLLSSKGNYSIKELARQCNMSIQTLEVNFADMIGIDPKTFAVMVRFNTAVLLKIYNPSLSWTHIAHTCGYYDQMHAIKTFKRFTNLTPKEFIKIIHPPQEEFV